ncbi:MAG: diheme cytochrome c [Desulfobacteraceae bacterium]|nr:diheme cytochrome c [Desulfobacteraceae bacterium]
MTKTRKWIIFLVAFLVMINGAFYTVLADHDDDNDREGKRRQHQKRYRDNSKDYKKRYLTPVNNPTYIEECGGCHFTYQPELLPSGSWDKILVGLEDHYGEAIELDPKSKKEIAEYLKANAAEYSSAKRAVKIMRSLGDRTPLRITQIPYIQEKHHEVPPKVLERDSIGSLSNCSACHTTAKKGIYEDDYVVIPP